MTVRFTIATLCCVMCSLPLYAGITDPCLAVKIPLADRIASATAIVHGRVIAQRSTWDDAHRSIYTINTVIVHDAWSTDAGVSDTISIVTEGGDMGAMGRTVIGALQLVVGDEGYLLLERPRRRDITLRNAGADGWFRPYAETQGLFVVRTEMVADCWGTTGLTDRNLSRSCDHGCNTAVSLQDLPRQSIVHRSTSSTCKALSQYRRCV